MNIHLRLERIAQRFSALMVLGIGFVVAVVVALLSNPRAGVIAGTVVALPAPPLMAVSAASWLEPPTASSGRRLASGEAILLAAVLLATLMGSFPGYGLAAGLWLCAVFMTPGLILLGVGYIRAPSEGVNRRTVLAKAWHRAAPWEFPPRRRFIVVDEDDEVPGQYTN